MRGSARRRDIRRRLIPPLLAIVVAACGPSTGRVDLAATEGRYEIILGGRGAEEHVVPANVAVQSGSEVHFVTADNRVHTVHFQIDDMNETAREFIRSTGQASSPPLISRGTRYVVSFQDAPRGFYPFHVLAHGEPVEGVVVVE